MAWKLHPRDRQAAKEFRRIPIRQIRKNPNQPRKQFEPVALEELADSIRRFGIITPLTVRQQGEGYELVAGERRLRAAAIAGLQTVPCYIVQVNDLDSGLMALLENLQRKDLDCFEEAASLRKLCEDYKMTQQEAAERIGKTQSAVANKLRLLKLPPVVIEQVRAFGLSERHARALLRLEEERQLAAVREIGTRGMTVAQTESYIERLLQEKPKNRRQTCIKDVRLFCNTVERAVRLMRESGVAADYKRAQEGETLIVTVRIPAAVAFKPRT